MFITTGISIKSVKTKEGHYVIQIHLMLDGSTYHHGLPANNKTAVRSHILSLCRSVFQCADSFVIYLNGPTTSDGSILLWDNNRNGKVGSLNFLSFLSTAF